MEFSNFFPLEQCFVVSLNLLEKILSKISGGPHSYWISHLEDSSLTIHYKRKEEKQKSAVSFTFPIITNLKLLNPAGKMICLYPMAAEQKHKALYLENGRMKNDAVEDWKRLWTPLYAGLAEYYSELGGSPGTGSKTSSSSAKPTRKRICPEPKLQHKTGTPSNIVNSSKGM